MSIRKICVWVFTLQKMGKVHQSVDWMSTRKVSNMAALLDSQLGQKVG